MPFDQEYESLDNVEQKKVNLKQVSSQKSIFDNAPKKPTKEEFENKVQTIEKKFFTHKTKLADLASQFVKLLSDKTLKQNKSVFQLEIEKEIITKMIDLGIEINNDPSEEKVDMGSISWITLLFKIVIAYRDKINFLEYTLSQTDKKIESLISKEVQLQLDKYTSNGNIGSGSGNNK